MEEASKSIQPGVSFVLGMVLVVCAVLVVTTIFLCFYHWSKLTAQYQNQLTADNANEADQKVVIILEPMRCEVPLVYMPGQTLPTFLAFAQLERSESTKNVGSPSNPSMSGPAFVS